MFNDKSPYTIRIEVADDVRHYFVSFIDGENICRETEVSRSVFLEIYKSIKKIRNLTRSDERHIEQSELTEETLYSRAMNPPQEVEEIVFDIERGNVLREAINVLPETQKRRFILYYDFNLTFEQIGKLEGCTHPAVLKSIRAAENKIKIFLENKVTF
ncbi:MAG: sigma-70 family RNA polymerase sigma factor [Eubacteriales bacterium]|nr:sigma-70 family RNA polymerase sigma factor [Eubacteriales bacterium]